MRRIHFIEIIPGKDYNNMEWCLQSWWCHRMDDNPKPKKNEYNCSACKTFFIDLNRIPKNINICNSLWIHSNESYYKNSCCELFNNIVLSDSDFYNKILENGICFHWTALTYKNLLEVKLKNRMYINQNNKKSDNYGEYINNYLNVKNYYKTIIDNRLLEYLDSRDINLLRE